MDDIRRMYTTQDSAKREWRDSRCIYHLVCEMSGGYKRYIASFNSSAKALILQHKLQDAMVDCECGVLYLIKYLTGELDDAQQFEN